MVIAHSCKIRQEGLVVTLKEIQRTKRLMKMRHGVCCVVFNGSSLPQVRLGQFEEQTEMVVWWYTT